MEKIKEILTRLRHNEQEYNTIRFSVAKRLFTLIASLYLLARLFTVGGFYFGGLTLTDLSLLTYHLYSLLVIATMFFGYAIIEYFAITSFPHKKYIILIPSLVILILIGSLALLSHLGFLHSFV